MRHTVLGTGLDRRNLVVALELQLLVLDGEDRIRAPLRLVAGAALGLRPTAPLVREQQLRAVVVERRRMPVGEVRVRGGVEARRIDRIADVEQDAMPFARATGQAERREHSDVVTLRQLGDR